MTMIDTHCHLDSPRLGNELQRLELLRRARAAGVSALILPGVSPLTWEALGLLASRLEQASSALAPPGLRLFPAYGVHPQALPELSDADLADGLACLSSGLAAQGVAVGECGLDGPTARAPGGAMERQLETLEAQLLAAEKAQRPVMLHCLGAHERLIRFLEHRGGVSQPIIMHSFSGSAELVPAYVRLGAVFSFTGPITYPNARKPVLAARAVPRDRLLVETDAPDQSPASARGQPNEPAFLPLILAGLARALDTDPATLARETRDNAIRIFRLPLTLSPTGAPNVAA